MKKTMIILGVVLAAFLMLATPCISAVNAQTVNTEIKENRLEKIEVFSEKIKTMLSNIDNKILINWDLFNWIVQGLSAFILSPLVFVILFLTPIGYIMFFFMFLQGLILDRDVVSSYISNFFQGWQRDFQDFMDGID